MRRALERHFGDDSSVAVQNRVKAMLAEAAVQIREDLRKQFASADSDDNPLAIYQRASLARRQAVLRPAAHAACAR